VGFQAEIVPSSVAKMKKLVPDAPPLLTTKSAGFVAANWLKTCPVGVLGPALRGGGGMVTTIGPA
jgi:hypothetical protein